jgi:L-alanine-DL-glutamate epimerase-like enolase superfamily enzyme
MRSGAATLRTEEVEDMKITKVETIHCDAGWAPWTFVKVQTDEGITGYGECSDWRSAHAIAGCVRDLEPVLVGQDPRPVEKLYWEMYRLTRQSPGGIAQKAIAGIDAALWDIKGKALGVPIYELLGGPLRDRVRLYWSHCGTYRARSPEILGTPSHTHDGGHTEAGGGGGETGLHGAQDQHRAAGRPRFHRMDCRWQYR